MIGRKGGCGVVLYLVNVLVNVLSAGVDRVGSIGRGNRPATRCGWRAMPRSAPPPP